MKPLPFGPCRWFPSRIRCRPRPNHRVRPRVEGLEERLAPATLSVNGGVVTFTAAPGEANQLVVNAKPYGPWGTFAFTDTNPIQVTGSGASAFKTTIANGQATVTGNVTTVDPLILTIDLGDGNDTLQVLNYQLGVDESLGGSLNITKSGSGSAAISLQGSGVNYDVPVNVFSPAGAAMSLQVDDTQDTTQQSWTIGPNQITSSRGNLITYAGLSALTLSTGAPGNAIDVNNPSAPTTITGNGLHDAITVEATTMPLSIRFAAAVIVGSNHTVSGLDGVVSVSNVQALTVDDSADLSTQNVTVNAGSITGLAPAAIEYSSVAALGIDGGQIARGDGGSVFTVTDTEAVTTLFTGRGSASNTVYVLGTDAPLIIYAQGQEGDAIVLGNAGRVQSLIQPISIDAQNGHPTVTVDDSADSLTPSATISGGGITGLAPATISFIGDALETLSVRGGGGGYVFTISAAAPSPPRDLMVFGGGTASLIVDDTADRSAVSCSITPSAVFGLPVREIDYVGGQWQRLTVEGDNASNTYFVIGTSTLTTLDCGDGADFVAVQSTSAPLTIDGQGGIDRVVIGWAGNVQGIAGTVTVTNEIAGTALSVVDDLDAVGRPVVVTAGALTGLAPAAIDYTASALMLLNIVNGAGDNTLTVDDSTDPNGESATINGGAVTGLLPMPVSYGGNLTALIVEGGGGVNTFHVTGTSVPTTLHTGTGGESVFVEATSAPLTIDGEGAIDGAVSLGLSQGNVQNLQGAITLTDSGSGTILDLDEVSDTTARTVTVTGSSITGLAPAPINYTASQLGLIVLEGGAGDALTVDDSADPSSRTATIRNGAVSGLIGTEFEYSGFLASLAVKGGGDGNAFTVLSLPGPTTLQTGNGNDQVFVQGADHPLTIDGQAGTNTVTFGAAGGLVGLFAPVSIASTGGSSVLTVDDSADPESRSMVITNTTITGLPCAGITYSNGTQVNLLLGNGNNAVDVSSFTGHAGLSGNGGNDTVTATANANFTLTDSLLLRSGGGGNAWVELSGFTNAGLTAGGNSGHEINALGFSGNATLTGGTGNDWIIAGSGADVLSGGPGTNTLVGGGGASTVVEAEDDSFLLTDALLTGTGAARLHDVLMNITAADLTDTNTTGVGRTLNAAAFSGDVTLQGGAGVNTLCGGHGTNEVTAAADASFTLANNALRATQGSKALFTDVLHGVFQRALLVDTNTDGTGRVLNGAAFGGSETLRGGAGNDTLVAGAGNDRLDGGAGNNVLLGGRGHDTLSGGGSGRNLLLAGAGPASLVAGSGGDILVGGPTKFDAPTAAGNFRAVNAVMAEWTSGDDYQARVAALSGPLPGRLNGTTFLNATTVPTPAHPSAVTLVGGSGLDWILTEPGDTFLSGT